MDITRSKAVQDLLGKADELKEALEETKSSFKEEPNPVLRKQYKDRYKKLATRYSLLGRVN